MDEHVVTDAEALRVLYGTPSAASLAKVADHVHPVYAPFIAAAPFAVLATIGSHGLDVSPRGDGPGFITIEDPKTLLLPDRRGNNRIDSLRNIINDRRVSLLFLIPGVGETLRVNGDAEVTLDPALLARFAVEGKAPRSVLRIHVHTVFFQCARALARSKLWAEETRIARSALPSTGTLVEALSNKGIDGAVYDRDLAPRTITTLY
jgi:PPOX class probable FMN-dependent enzyme